MAVRPYTIVIAFIAGAAIAVMTYPALRGLAGSALPRLLSRSATPRQQGGRASRPCWPWTSNGLSSRKSSCEQAGPATIAQRLTVPGTIVPNAERVAHVSVKLSGTVAELRKKIGDDVDKDEVIAVLESREVADAKSEYLAARLTNDLQQESTSRRQARFGKAGRTRAAISHARATPRRRAG